MIVGLHGMNDYSNAYHLARPNGWAGDRHFAPSTSRTSAVHCRAGRGVWAPTEPIWTTFGPW
ncbi:hypothetical protein ACRAWD_03890 [Caulobacter segnis]